MGKGPPTWHFRRQEGNILATKIVRGTVHIVQSPFRVWTKSRLLLCCTNVHTCPKRTVWTVNNKKKGELKVHMMAKFTGEKPFKCNQCKYTCAATNTFHSHTRWHSGEKLFKCNQCSKAYLPKHFRIHITSD